MDRAPKGPGVGLPFIVVAIAAALGLGAYFKARPSPYADVPTPVYVAYAGTLAIKSSEVGTGVPRNPSGHEVVDALQKGLAIAAWARIDPLVDGRVPAQWPGGMGLLLRDEKGATWRLFASWHEDALYVLVPFGYERPPRRLALSVVDRNVGDGGKVIASLTFPPLPSSPAPIPPHVDGPWPGLTIEPVNVKNAMKNYQAVRLDAPLPPRDLLVAKPIYTSEGQSAPWAIAQPIKAGEVSQLNQILPCSPIYPRDQWTAYIEAIQLTPRHVHRRLTFLKIPYVVRFGEVWLAGSSAPVSIGNGVQASVGTDDPIPTRAPRHKHSTLQLDFRVRGAQSNISPKLVKVEWQDSVPVTLRTISLSENVPPLAATPLGDLTKDAKQMNVTLDVDLDLFEVKHRAVIEAKLSKSLTKTLTLTSGQGFGGPMNVLGQRFDYFFDEISLPKKKKT